MKYIKTFENNDLTYKIDDYVYFVGYGDDISNFGKINKINKSKHNRTWDYSICTPEVNNIYIDEDDIDRKLTIDEIEEYKIKILSKKFNI